MRRATGLPSQHSCKTDFIKIIMCMLWNYNTVSKIQNMIINKMTM